MHSARHRMGVGSVLGVATNAWRWRRVGLLFLPPVVHVGTIRHVHLVIMYADVDTAHCLPHQLTWQWQRPCNCLML
jgi:hypothetical protein